MPLTWCELEGRIDILNTLAGKLCVGAPVQTIENIHDSAMFTQYNAQVEDERLFCLRYTGRISENYQESVDNMLTQIAFELSGDTTVKKEYVSVSDSTTITSILVSSGAAAAGGGGAGSTVASTAGAAGTVFVQTSALLSYVGLSNGNVGTAGAGGPLGAGTAVSPTFVTSGGASGGGTTAAANNQNAGGNITGVGSIPTISGGLAGGGNGSSGYLQMISNNSSSPSVFYSTGGAGGGSNGNGSGGNGGNGSYGSGGGGGGAGTSSGSGGRGGNGGNGLVIIVAW